MQVDEGAPDEEEGGVGVLCEAGEVSFVPLAWCFQSLPELRLTTPVCRT